MADKPQRLLRFALSILSVWLLASQAIFAKSNAQTVQAFKLIQSHITLGPIDVYYTKDAVKMVLKNNGSTLLARAPTWKVVIYRPAVRIAYEVSMQSFRQRGLRFVPVSYIPDCNFHRVSEQQVKGETVIELAGHDEKDRNFRYWMIDPVNIPIEACEILDRAIRVPVRHAIALKVTGDEPGHDDVRSRETITWHLGANERYPGGRTATWRITTLEWTKLTLPAAEFAYPVGYKLVDREPDVFMTARSREVFEDLLIAPSDDKHSGSGSKKLP
jgi:hypothetical protein